MDNTDLISVIIPTYNRAHLIKRSVESVLNQTYKNLELIIVDDGSTDNTKEVIDSVNDKRIIYTYQTNQGVSAARNKGIDLAKGKYIAFQDSDDVWHTDKLEIQIQKLKENNADIIYTKRIVFGNLRKKILPKESIEGFLDKKELPLTVAPSTLLGKREIFLNNKFDLSLLGIEDFELALRINKKHSIYFTDKPLIDYYTQKDSLSNNAERELKDFERILKNNTICLKDYSYHSLENLALSLLNKAVTIRDKKKKEKWVKFVFNINNSNKVKISYLFHKLNIYKIRSMMVKSFSIPT
nr:glycosyltransferase [Endomicrobiaceae bacterium]